MIKVTVDKGCCKIHEISGTGVNIMSELCVIVKAVCLAFSEDEIDSSEMCSEMVSLVADALKHGEESKRGT